jgi:hypothetical protein
MSSISYIKKQNYQYLLSPLEKLNHTANLLISLPIICFVFQGEFGPQAIYATSGNCRLCHLFLA